VKLRIFIVTTSFASGGAERVAVNLARQYASEGHEVTIVAFNGDGPYRDQVGETVRIIDLQSSRVRYSFWKLFCIFKREPFDIVLSVIRNSNIIVGLTAYFFPSVKLVLREANTMNFVAQQKLFSRSLYLILMRIAYYRAKKVIANSEDTKDDIVNYGVVKASKVVVIGNPVLPYNLVTLKSEPPEHPWLKDPSLQVVLSVGRLHKQKNQQMLIKAFAEVQSSLRNVRLIILGEGEEKESLLNLIETLGVSETVDIVPFCSNPYPFYVNADLFVLTSNWEGFGNVLVEAMACGTLVISTDCPGGPRYILKNGLLGKLVAPNDIKQLSLAMMSFLKKEVVFNKRELVERASEFSVSSMASRYFEEMEF